MQQILLKQYTMSCTSERLFVCLYCRTIIPNKYKFYKLYQRNNNKIWTKQFLQTLYIGHFSFSKQDQEVVMVSTSKVIFLLTFTLISLHLRWFASKKPLTSTNYYESLILLAKAKMSIGRTRHHAASCLTLLLPSDQPSEE